MKKIALASLLAVLVAGSSHATSVPERLKKSVKDHYIIWTVGGGATVCLASAVMYDVIKNDKKMLKAARDLAKTMYKKTFEKHPYATTTFVLFGLIGVPVAWDVLIRDESCLNVFSSKDNANDEEEKKETQDDQADQDDNEEEENQKKEEE